MKLYLAGPMTYRPQFNFPVFDRVSQELRELGLAIVSPAELDDEDVRAACMASEDGNPADLPRSFTYGETLGRDIEVVLDEVDGVACLPGWHTSRGARLEVTAARLWGKSVYQYMEDTSLTKLSDEVLDTLCKPDAQEKPPPVAGEDSSIDPVLRASGHIEAGEQLSEALSDPWVASREPGHIHAELAPAREVRVTSDTGGQKGRKPERLGLIPQEALWELGRVYGFGAEKYDDHNYLRGYSWNLSIDAGMRHFSQFVNGEDYDPESGLHHLAHAAWHCFALMMFQWHALGTDDRMPSVTSLTAQTIDPTGRSEAARS